MYQYVGISMMVVGFLWALWFAVKYGLTYLPKRGASVEPAVTMNSDAPAPVGIGPYTQLVKKASPTASAENRWGYVAAGLTEAEVLRLEVDRLGKGAT